MTTTHDPEPYYLWSHPRETARVCRPSEATFAAGEPEWVREYPVEAVGVVMNRVFEGRATKTASLYESGKSLPVGTLLYAHPLPVQVEERQPLTEASIELGREEYGGERFDFTAGVRFAERAHCIGSAGTDGGAKSHE